MGKPNDAETVAYTIGAEQRGIGWARRSVGQIQDNLRMAQADLPDTEEYAAVRMAVARALARLREAHGVLGAVADAMAAAKLAAEDVTPVYVTDPRLKGRQERYTNGAEEVQRARRDRAQREATFAERQRQQREAERQAWLASRKGEGMRDGQD